MLAVSPDVVISEVYGGGGNAGATLTNDFIELFNRGSSAVSLNGWSVQYASTTGTTWSRTNLTNVTLAPGQSYLVQEAAGAGGTTPLPTPDASGLIAMSADRRQGGPAQHARSRSCRRPARRARRSSTWSATAPRDQLLGGRADREPVEHDVRGAHRHLRSTPITTSPTSRSALPHRGTPRRRSSRAAAVTSRSPSHAAARCRRSKAPPPVTRQITASDPDDIVDDIALTSVTPANGEITLGATTPAAADGGTASATLSVGTSNPGTYQVVHHGLQRRRHEPADRRRAPSTSRSRRSARSARSRAPSRIPRTA